MQSAIEAAQFGGALLLSLALHVPAYFVLTQLRGASSGGPLLIEGRVVMAEAPPAQAPPPAPAPVQHPPPPAISAQMTPVPPAAPPPPAPTTESSHPEAAAADAQAAGGGVRARILSSLESETESAKGNEFVVAPPVPGDENAPLPFGLPPGSGSPAHPPEGPGGPGTGSGGGEDPAVRAALQSYRLRLYQRTMAQAHYPAEAIARGWQGNVMLRMQFGQNGTLLNVAVGESSGYAVLDQEAVEMAKRANSLAPVPKLLRDRKFTVMIPVVFQLVASPP